MEIINSYKCETCNYTTNTKTNLGIHCKSKKHCHRAGIPYEVKKITNKVFTDVMEDVTKYNDLKKFDMDLQATTFLQEINKLKEQLQRQEEANSIKEEMTALKHEIELLKEKNKYQEEMYTRLLTDKDAMIQYLMTAKKAPIQVAPQVASQDKPLKALKNELKEEKKEEDPLKALKTELKEEKKEEDPDDDVLNKSYLKKYCQMDSINFCKNLEVIDTDYQLFMEGEFVPMKRLMCQILERELKRITLHEMGVVVLPNDKIFTYIDEWTESSKGLQHIRTWISKQLQLFLIEDPVYENIQYMTDDDFEGYKPTLKQADQYKDGTEIILQLQEERHEIDKEIRAILKHYSTK
jgi:hypothetical protein